MARVAAISAGPRSASPRGSRARSFWGFFGFSAMGGVGTSRRAMRQPRLLLPLPLLPRSCGGGSIRRSPLRRGGLALGLHFGGVVGHQLLGNRTGLELPLRDLRHRRDLGGGAGDEAFAEARKFLRHDATLDHLDAAAFGEIDRGRPGDAGEEAVGYGRG